MFPLDDSLHIRTRAPESANGAAVREGRGIVFQLWILLGRTVGRTNSRARTPHEYDRTTTERGDPIG